MAGPTNPVSDHLRTHKQEIGNDWEALALAQLPILLRLGRGSLLNHLPEFLEGLARWIDGDAKAAREGFGALAEGHALQRLSSGIDLTTLTREYALLRTAITRSLLSVPTSDQIREPMVRLNEGLDEAIYEAVRRYTFQRDQVRDRFIGILAHDLRSPLNTVAMAAANIMSAVPQPGDRIYRMGSAISRAVDRMVHMIDDVIELARGHLGGKMPVTLEPGNLDALVAEAISEQRIAHPERSISLESSGDLDGVWDRGRVLQLVTNLLSNAMTYGEDPIVVTLRESADRQHLLLSVNNKGPTISAARIATLFDPLRLETPGTRKGLGLGLYIVRQIALAHGARCEVQSNDVDGTTVSVIWPRTPGDEVPSRL